MADDKKSRDKQAHDQERRQRERALEEQLERMGEPEPPIPDENIADIEKELGGLEYPATGAEVVESVGGHVIESVTEDYRVEELVPDTEEEKFGSPSEVRERIQRPTVAEAMKRVVEASETVQHTGFGESQREADEKTFRELKTIDAEDEDEGVQAIADWIVEKIREKEKLPESRDVRRQAAKFCRANGYSVRNDEWLGI
ncbi:MAG: hypothetical protein ACLFR5_02865 [Halobacteriales archaeon]